MQSWSNPALKCETASDRQVHINRLIRIQKQPTPTVTTTAVRTAPQAATTAVAIAVPSAQTANKKRDS